MGSPMTDDLLLKLYFLLLRQRLVPRLGEALVTSQIERNRGRQYGEHIAERSHSTRELTASDLASVLNGRFSLPLKCSRTTL